MIHSEGTPINYKPTSSRATVLNIFLSYYIIDKCCWLLCKHAVWKLLSRPTVTMLFLVNNFATELYVKFLFHVVLRKNRSINIYRLKWRVKWTRRIWGMTWKTSLLLKVPCVKVMKEWQFQKHSKIRQKRMKNIEDSKYGQTWKFQFIVTP